LHPSLALLCASTWVGEISAPDFWH